MFSALIGVIFAFSLTYQYFFKFEITLLLIIFYDYRTENYLVCRGVSDSPYYKGGNFQGFAMWEQFDGELMVVSVGFFALASEL